ncbi:alpha/beta fold hydrolase [Nocardia sp. NPDC051052]|uniref:alpha/beta fold hydrolase n=1 Tax=Nocardia sp. NPDC051052 TaxID=3364322 RepID=UPI0037875925
MTEWNRIERGEGRPLVLLHGGGASARCWLPVLDRLSAQRRVIALDFPGFGQTPAPGPDVHVSMDWIVDGLAAELPRLGINGPVDLVGNSMGGLIGLEATKRGLASSFVGLAPVALWHKQMPLALRAQFQVGLAAALLTRTAARSVVGKTRSVGLWFPVGHPDRMTAVEAVDFVRDFDHSGPTLRRALKIAKKLRFEGGQGITVPVTIAFGTLDRMLPPSTSQVRDQLPAHTKWVTLPDCGHMPMWDNPELVANTILDGVSTTRSAGEQTA